jgi:hypothetical protein
METQTIQEAAAANGLSVAQYRKRLGSSWATPARCGQGGRTRRRRS